MLSYPYLFDIVGEPPFNINIVTWADGSDEDIVAMIKAADEEKINLSDYWAVGDERTFHLSAIGSQNPKGYSGTGMPTSMSAQDVVMVLMNEGYMDQDGLHFVVGQKDCLTKTGRLTASNSCRCYDSSAMPYDLKDKYYNAFSETIRPIFKTFRVLVTDVSDWSRFYIIITPFTLFAEKEIWGSQIRASEIESNKLESIEYYETSINRIKQINGVANTWLTRTVSYNANYSSGNVYYSAVDSSGNNTYSRAYDYGGIAPFGCI